MVTHLKYAESVFFLSKVDPTINCGINFRNISLDFLLILHLPLKSYFSFHFSLFSPNRVLGVKPPGAVPLTLVQAMATFSFFHYFEYVITVLKPVSINPLLGLLKKTRLNMLFTPTLPEKAVSQC